MKARGEYAPTKQLTTNRKQGQTTTRQRLEPLDGPRKQVHDWHKTYAPMDSEIANRHLTDGRPRHRRIYGTNFIAKPRISKQAAPELTAAYAHHIVIRDARDGPHQPGKSLRDTIVHEHTLHAVSVKLGCRERPWDPKETSDSSG